MLRQAGAGDQVCTSYDPFNDRGTRLSHEVWKVLVVDELGLLTARIMIGTGRHVPAFVETTAATATQLQALAPGRLQR